MKKKLSLMLIFCLTFCLVSGMFCFTAYADESSAAEAVSAVSESASSAVETVKNSNGLSPIVIILIAVFAVIAITVTVYLIINKRKTK